jgi:hypothetical protein
MNDIIKIRCSAIGRIMTSSKTKGEQLSKTTKSYIQELALENKYGVLKEFSSKYTDKGNEVENESIALTMDVLNLGFIYKNEDHYSNEWIKGTPDVCNDEVLLDVKSSWDATTFPFFANDVPNKDYYYQLQGYMWLTDKQTSLLCYCLINTPLQIVEDEVRREHWKQYAIDERKEIRDFVEAKHNFNHIPKEKKVKVFEIERDEDTINEIKEKVKLCREYYNQIIEII